MVRFYNFVKPGSGVNIVENELGRFMALENYRGSEYLFESRFLSSLLQPGDVAVDCNANVGKVTVAMSRAVGDLGGVFAFESQTFLFHMLCGNLALNRITNAQAFNRAIGDVGCRSFYVPNFTYREEMDFGAIGYASRIGTEDGDGNIYCKPIAALTIDELSFREMKLMRLDLGGCELQALIGSRETIRRCRPVLFVRMVKNLEETLEFFKAEKYEWSVVDVNEGSRRLSVLAYPAAADVTEWFEGSEFVDIDSSDDPEHQALKEAKTAVY